MDILLKVCLIFLGIFFLLYFLIILDKEKERKQEEKKQKILAEINQKIKILEQLNKNIEIEKKQLKELKEDQQQFQVQLLEKKNKKKEWLQAQYQITEQFLKQQYQKKQTELQAKYQLTLKEQSSEIAKIQTARKQAQSNLDQIINTYKAASAARLRQQAEIDKKNFYKIQITDKQIADISSLQQWKEKLNDPSIVSKIIWSSYIMKPTSDMCNRVLGKTVCGIYKITNLIDGKIYVGQSVNIPERFKQHVKCGLGIDASATNLLYNAMQETGVWNYMFELLEQCPRNNLNERERFWIDFYQANKIGYNVTRGNKT